MRKVAELSIAPVRGASIVFDRVRSRGALAVTLAALSALALATTASPATANGGWTDFVGRMADPPSGRRFGHQRQAGPIPTLLCIGRHVDTWHVRENQGTILDQISNEVMAYIDMLGVSMSGMGILANSNGTIVVQKESGREREIDTKFVDDVLQPERLLRGVREGHVFGLGG